MATKKKPSTTKKVVSKVKKFGKAVGKSTALGFAVDTAISMSNKRPNPTDGGKTRTIKDLVKGRKKK